MSDIVPTTAAPRTALELISEAARDPAVDVAKLQALLAMQERLEERAAVAALNTAIGRISAVIPRIPKNGLVKLGERKGTIPFAKFEDMDDVLRPLMRQEGLTPSYDMTEAHGGLFKVVTEISHRDGASKFKGVFLPRDDGPGRNALQAMGSTFSYGKRYGLEAHFNIVREGDDDDGKRGGTRVIDLREAAAIDLAIRELGIDERRFLDLLNANSVQEIAQADLAQAHNMIAVKRRSLEKKGDA